MIIQTFYIPFGEKCNCWKPQISGIDYNILGIKIWIARMIQITSQITLKICIKMSVVLNMRSIVPMKMRGLILQVIGQISRSTVSSIYHPAVFTSDSAPSGQNDVTLSEVRHLVSAGRSCWRKYECNFSVQLSQAQLLWCNLKA